MKNILLFQIIFVFIFSACSDFSGNEDAVEASLKPAPVTRNNNNNNDDDDDEKSLTNYYLQSRFSPLSFPVVEGGNRVDQSTSEFAQERGSSKGKPFLAH